MFFFAFCLGAPLYLVQTINPCVKDAQDRHSATIRVIITPALLSNKPGIVVRPGPRHHGFPTRTQYPFPIFRDGRNDMLIAGRKVVCPRVSRTAG